MNQPTQRNTMQKNIVLETVRSMKNHPTADMVYENLHDSFPTISKATVYRILGQLSSKGDIRKIPVPDGADRYDFCLTPHYHVRCTVCGKLDDIFMDSIIQLEEPDKYIKSPTEFTITGGKVIFEGICPLCREHSLAEKEALYE